MTDNQYTKAQLATRVIEVATAARKLIHESFSDCTPRERLLLTGRIMSVLYINHYSLVLSAGQKAQDAAESQALQVSQPETTQAVPTPHE